MAGKKKSLGKGVDGIIPLGKIEIPESKVVEKVVEKVIEKKIETMIRVADIEPNKGQPRKNFNEDSLQELADSIKLHGVIQPLILQKKEGYYEIIAGERRWRAAKLAGLKEVPAIIKDYSDKEIMEIALIENIQREDLNPIEEAQAYKRLLKEYNLKQDEVAERVSKSRVAITNSMRLLKLSEQVQQMVVDEKLSSGHARALIAIEEEKLQISTAEKIFDEKLSVRETEKLVKAVLSPKEPKVKEVYKDEFVYEEIKEKISSVFGTQVKINRKTKEKGKIEISYFSNEELDRIIALINKIKK